jgi:hypothetical protein
MLYLNPPFQIIEGVSVFADHGDPMQYYYLPLSPKLSTFPDAAGRQTPQLQLIKFRGAAGNGGFLNFDVNIGVEQQTLNRIQDKIRSQSQLNATPRLGPVDTIDGSVRLLLLGKQTGDPAAAPDPTGAPRFVLKIDQAAKPALYGDNQAAFSVSLDPAGVTVLEEALQGESSPIGIVYSLEFLALRPAYAVQLSIDWDRVQKHLDDHFTLDAIFVSEDIEKAVDELREKRAIVLQADTFIPEGEDNAAVLARRDKAITEVYEMITDAFFKPTVDPVKQEPDGWDRFTDTANRLSQLAITGGWSSAAHFTKKQIDYTRIDRKSLNVNLSERTAVKRTIYPQGHLAGLARVLTQGGFRLSDFVTSVDLDDPYFQRRRVAVISRGNFEQDSIGSLAVRLTYGSEPHDVVLESSTARASAEWGSILTAGAMKREVTTQFTVRFKDVDGTQRPLQLDSAPTKTTDDSLEIDPRQLYAIVPVPCVAVPNFPWDHYPQVEVRLAYTDEANGIGLNETLILNKSHPDQTWKMFVRNAARTQFKYKLLFRAADNTSVEGPWLAGTEARVDVADPRPNKLVVVITPSLNWDTVSRAFVDVSYEDSENDLLVEQSFEFSKDATASQSFRVDLVNPKRRQVSYQVTILFADTRVVTVPRSVTQERRIIVRSDLRGHRIISVHPAAVEFAARNLQQMTVELGYEDVTAGLSFADVFTFQSAADHANFEFDYVSDQRSAYRYRVSYLATNGLQRTTDWTSSSADDLAIPVG